MTNTNINNNPSFQVTADYIMEGFKAHKGYLKDIEGEAFDYDYEVRLKDMHDSFTEQCISWEEVEGFENYIVTEMGEVWNIKTARKLACPPNKWGYHYANLSNNGESKSFTVHSLVAKHFLGEAPEGMETPEIDHIVPDKSNNSVYNLQWLSKKDNILKSNK